MNKLETITSLSIVESCSCNQCSKSGRSYIFKFKNTNIYFYCWEDKTKVQFLYFLDCPYKTHWDDFGEISFQDVFDSLSEDYKEVILFNLELFK